MLWRGLIIGVVATAVAAGCQSANGRKSAEATTKPKAEDRFPETPPWAKNSSVPAAGSWGDPRDTKFDTAGASKGLISGYVEEADGRKARDVAITIEAADNAQAKEKPIVTLADRSGAFMVPNLTPGVTYSITAQTRDGGRTLVGQTFATVPSVHVRIRLKEDIAISSPSALPKPSAPVETTGNLPPALPSAAGTETTIATPPIPGGPDGAWSPTATPLRNLTPSNTNINIAPPLPSSGEMPTPVVPAVVPSRPDLNTATPQPEWRAPVTNVPGPSTPPSIPGLPNLDPSPSGRSGANKPTVKNQFTVIDPMGRDRDFPTRRPGQFVLLDFMTTTCVPCIKATPRLVAFQRAWGGRGVEVVAIACDPMPPSDRRAAANQYARKHEVKNYLIHTEPGPNPGLVQKQFNIVAYPSLVLLDPWGEILWQGHPSDLAKAEAILEEKTR